MTDSVTSNLCGTCGETHELGKYYNHNFVVRPSNKIAGRLRTLAGHPGLTIKAAHDIVDGAQEIDRLTRELEEWHQLKKYAASLGQRTYLELHAENKRLREALEKWEGPSNLAAWNELLGIGEPEHGNKALQVAAAVALLKAAFEEACNEVKMCHDKPCFCKYCWEPSEAAPGGGSDTSKPVARGVATGSPDETSTELEQLRRIDTAARRFVDSLSDDAGRNLRYRELCDALFDGRPAEETTAPLTREERLRSPNRCPVCDGLGYSVGMSRRVPCEPCAGTGIKPQPTDHEGRPLTYWGGLAEKAEGLHQGDVDATKRDYAARRAEREPPCVNCGARKDLHPTKYCAFYVGTSAQNGSEESLTTGE